MIKRLNIDDSWKCNRNIEDNGTDIYSNRSQQKNVKIQGKRCPSRYSGQEDSSRKDPPMPQLNTKHAGPKRTLETSWEKYEAICKDNSIKQE